MILIRIKNKIDISSIRTCKNCKHRVWPLWRQAIQKITDDVPRCGRYVPETKVNVVTGRISVPKFDDFHTCHGQRSHDGSEGCGEIGKHWVPKKKSDLFELIKHTDDISNDS